VKQIATHPNRRRFSSDESVKFSENLALSFVHNLSFFPSFANLSLSLVCDLSGQQEGFGCKKLWGKEFCARAKSSMGRCNGPRGSGEMVTGCIVTLQVADDKS
jgi:hypothetical protein